MIPSAIWLLGDPVSRSLSPAMQNAAFDALGLDWRYVTREVNREGLPRAIDQMRADSGVLGANVTIPHKEAVIPLLDELDPVASRIGAVNTISREGQSLKGSNTDVAGFTRALDECGYAVEGKAIAIIGAGGAARAVATALQSRTPHLTVVARNLDQALQVCRDLGLDLDAAMDLARAQQAVTGADVIVNATPADLPPPSWVRPQQRVFDLRSRRSLEGRAMLLQQGAASFEIWTGREAPLEAMRAALEHAAEAVVA